MLATDAPARPWAVLAYSLILDAAEVREGTTGLTVGQRNYLDTLDNDDIGAAIEAAVEELGLMKHYAQTRQRAAQLLLDRAADQPVLVLPDDTGAPVEAQALVGALGLDPQHPRRVIVEASRMEAGGRGLADELVDGILLTGAAEHLEVHGASMRFAGELVRAATARGVAGRLSAVGTRRQPLAGS